MRSESTAAATTTAAITWDTVSLHMTFNDNPSATTYLDSSSYGNHGAMAPSTGDPLVTHDTVNVKFGSACYHNSGSGPYIVVTPSTRFVLTGTFTIQCWFRPTSTGILNTVINIGNINQTGGGLLFRDTYASVKPMNARSSETPTSRGPWLHGSNVELFFNSPNP